MEFSDLSSLIVAIGALTIVVNIITEVIKKILSKKIQNEIPLNIIVVVISILLTLFSFVAYQLYYGHEITWYTVVASMIAGFFVAYSAMFGYDKLKDSLSQIKK